MTTIKKIQTTSDANGYQTNLKPAYIGFETWAEAKKFAEEKDLALMCLSQKAGWQVWYREDSVYEPMTITAADYGDDYNFETDAEKYFENEREILEDCDTIEEADEDNYLDLLYKHFGKGVSFLIAHKEVEFNYDTDYILIW